MHVKCHGALLSQQLLEKGLGLIWNQVLLMDAGTNTLSSDTLQSLSPVLKYPLTFFSLERDSDEAVILLTSALWVLT